MSRAKAWPRTDHFDGKHFFNPGAEQARGFKDLLKWVLHRHRGHWQSWTENEAHALPPARVAKADLRVTFVGHATVLVQFDEMNLLTDPIWSMRASPVQWTGPKRHRPPGLALDTLPPIDAVLLSHSHYDHCDVSTLRELSKRFAPEIFVPLGLAGLARRCGFAEIRELDWWDELAFRGMIVRCLPAQHFSARTPFDRNRTLWCGWSMESPEGGTVIFLGDSGFGDHLRAIAERCPHPRLAMLPIGAFAPEWFMGPIHMTPEQAVEAHHILKAQQSMAVHCGTFPLADDGEFEPVRRLARELERRRDGTRFWWLQPGEGRTLY